MFIYKQLQVQESSNNPEVSYIIVKHSEEIFY